MTSTSNRPGRYSITELTQTLEQWILRLRLQRALTWSMRGFILGLALALVAGSFGLYRADLLRSEFLTLIITTSLLSALLCALVAFFWRVQRLQAARQFDRLFHLGERVSTALELHQDHRSLPVDMLRHQLADAVTASKNVDTRRSLPLRMQHREGMIALLLVALLSALWLRGDSWFQAAQQARDVEHAVEQQAAQIEELIKEINANEALSEQQKEALTKPLEQAQESLQENPSLENSVSVLTSTGEQMEALSREQSEQMAQALQETGNQLAQQNSSPLEAVGEELAQGNYSAAASKLQAIDVDELSDAEKQQLAEQLQSLAESLQSTNPELAEELSQAAQALQNGDSAAAQQALNNAAQSLAQSGQQITFSQAASQSASQLQQGADQVLAAGGGQQQANQTGQGQGSGQQANNGSGGSGSGSGSESGDPQTGEEADSAPIDQNNGPGDGGEESYEQIYAPSLLGGDGGPQVGLPNSGSGEGDVIGQGPTTPGDPNASLVPYNDVYSQYEQINNQAMENGEVPSQFIEIIKNYFDSLEP